MDVCIAGGGGRARDDSRTDPTEEATGEAGQMNEVVAERRRLLSLAYRMTGTIADSEDVVQETYVRWYRMTDPERDAIRSPAAWLTRVASRIALDLLGSARARREAYVGQWLPEPVPADLFAETAPPLGSSAQLAADPLDRITLEDTVSTAMLMVLEAMTPAERVAFVLHDVFKLPFDEIAEIVGRSPVAARQLASSARRHVREGRRVRITASEHDRAVRAFLDASLGGDVDRLLRLLAPGVELRADGGGLVKAAPNAVHGRARVARFLLGVLDRQPALRFQERRTADGLGYALQLHGRLFGVLTFGVEAGTITDLWLVVNPAKLTSWTR